MPAVFQRLEDRRMSQDEKKKKKTTKTKKPYKPVMTTAPVLLLFIVVAVVCVALLQNIVESGTPLHDRYDEGGNSQTQHRLKRKGLSLPSADTLPLLPRQAGSSTTSATNTLVVTPSTPSPSTTTTTPNVEVEVDTFSSTTTTTPNVEIEVDTFSSTTTTSSSIEVEVDTFTSTTTTSSIEVESDTFTSTTTTSSVGDEDSSTTTPVATVSSTTSATTLTTTTLTTTTTTPPALTSSLTTTTTTTTTISSTTSLTASPFTTTSFSSSSTEVSTTTTELTTTSSSSPVPDPGLVCDREVDAYYIDSAETLISAMYGGDLTLNTASCLDFCINNMDDCQSVIFEDPENKCYFFMDTFQTFNLGGNYDPEERTDSDNHYFFSDGDCESPNTTDPLSSTTQSSTTFTTNSTTITSITSTFSINTTTTTSTSTPSLMTTTLTPTTTITTTTNLTTPTLTPTTTSTLTTTTPTPITTTTTPFFSSTTTPSPPTSTISPSSLTTTSTLIIDDAANPPTSSPTTPDPIVPDPTTTQSIDTSTPSPAIVTLSTTTATSSPETTSPLASDTASPPLNPITSDTTSPASPASTPDPVISPNTDPVIETTTSAPVSDVVEGPQTSTTPSESASQSQSGATVADAPVNTALQSSDTVSNSDGISSNTDIEQSSVPSDTAEAASATQTSETNPLTGSQSDSAAAAAVPTQSAIATQASETSPVTAAESNSGAAAAVPAQSDGATQASESSLLTGSQSDSAAAATIPTQGASATQASENTPATAAESNSGTAAAVPTQSAGATQALGNTASTAAASNSGAAAAVPTQASQDPATAGSIAPSQQTDPTAAQATNPATAVPASNAVTQSQAANSAAQTAAGLASDANSISGQATGTDLLSGSNTIASGTQPSESGTSVSIVAVALSNDPTATATALISDPASETNGTRSGTGSGSSGAGGDSGAGGGGGSGTGGDIVHPVTDSSPFILTLPVPVTDTTLYAAIFVMVTMSVLFKSFWCVVFASAKMMEPFYQLSKEATMVTAESSVLRQYLQAGIEWRDLNPKNKHWVMFLTTIVSILLSVQASIASEAMTVQAGATCDTQNGTKLCDPVWVVNYAVVRGLQTTLCIAVVAISILVYLNWNRPSALFSYPCSIASMASLLSNSEDEVVEILRSIDPDAKARAVKKAMKGNSFTFRRTHAQPGSDILGVSVQINEVSPTEPLTQPATTSRAVGDGLDAAGLASGAHLPSSWIDRVPWSKGYVALITLLHLALFGVILSFVLAGNDIYEVNLTGEDGKQHLTAVRWQFLDGTKFGPRFFMTLLVSFLFTPFWERFELAVRAMVPYRRLQRGNKEGHHLLTMYLHGVPFTSFFQALRHKNWYHAYIAFTTMLSYLLLILIAGVPYNYGQIKNVSFYSSLVSVAILGFMLVAMVSLIFWEMGNPRTPRKPDTLVNSWLLMCASGFVDELKGRPLHEITDDLDSGNSRYWFRKATGVDGIQRWMVDSEGVDDWRLRRQASTHLLDATSSPKPEQEQEQHRYF